MLNLRELIAMGFCGRGLSGPTSSQGAMHAILDSVIADFIGKLNELESYGTQTGVCNTYSIQYKDHVTFRKMLSGIASRAKDLAGVTCSKMTSANARFTLFRANNGNVIEPLYEWASTQYRVPIYGIASAYLGGVSNPKIRSISMLGDFDVTSEFEETGGFEFLLSGSADALKTVPGGQCLSCPKKDCKFVGDFDTTVFEWMKAQQKMEELEALVKEHLVMRGPTKVGSHLVYMKESRRRSFDANRRDELMEILNGRLTPMQIQDCLKPDATAILSHVKAGKIPAIAEDMFNVTTSYHIDTKLSL